MNRIANALGLFLVASIASAQPSGTEAARAVLERMIGGRAGEFTLTAIPAAEGGLDVYEVEAKEGKVNVGGNSPVSIARGAYAYLKEACHAFQGWEGAHLDLPARMPDWPKQRVVSPYGLRPYYNVCTFGYTTAFWDWPRWQRELDWMALHGINAALAEVGTEAIWDRVWKEEGISQEALDRYFPGPAFMPWHRMGNINRWQGPPPKSWFAKQVALEKKILARMRELGIEPIAPAFAGFAPPELAQVHPGTKLEKLSGWGGFTPEYGTWLLDPTSPLYPEIGGRYIKDWESEFGRNHLFLADSFNELEVPVPADRPGRLATLARYGDAVYRSILAGDPQATWVMQGWLFYNDSDFWDRESVQALLSKVPDDRMIILDLACDFRPIWSSQGAFYGKQWIYSVIQNFGGRSTLGGDLNFFAVDAAKTLAAPNHGRLVGFGLAPEGVENNEVVYELLTDSMWTRGPIDLDSWLRSYCLTRYGACPDALISAWRLLCKSCYGHDIHAVRTRWYQHTPGPAPNRPIIAPDDSPEFREAVRLFLSCSPELKGSALFRADAIELTVQYLGSLVDAMLVSNRTPEALSLMDSMDTLLAAHPVNRLDRWVGFARAWGDTPAEADYYEADSKWLVTLWGGTLSEYSRRVWNGLIGTYYRERWALDAQARAAGTPFDLRAWEEKWINTPYKTKLGQAPADPLAECERLLSKQL